MQRRTFLTGSAALAGAALAGTPPAFAQGKPETQKVAIAVGGVVFPPLIQWLLDAHAWREWYRNQGRSG